MRIPVICATGTIGRPVVEVRKIMTSAPISSGFRMTVIARAVAPREPELPLAPNVARNRACTSGHGSGRVLSREKRVCSPWKVVTTDAECRVGGDYESGTR